MKFLHLAQIHTVELVGDKFQCFEVALALESQYAKHKSYKIWYRCKPMFQYRICSKDIGLHCYVLYSNEV